MVEATKSRWYFLYAACLVRAAQTSPHVGGDCFGSASLRVAVAQSATANSVVQALVATTTLSNFTTDRCRVPWRDSSTPSSSPRFLIVFVNLRMAWGRPM